MLRLRHDHPSIDFQPTSRGCEIGFDNNKIEKGEDIANLYLRKNPFIDCA
jgi:hypothetical protein